MVLLYCPAQDSETEFVAGKVQISRPCIISKESIANKLDVQDPHA